MKNSLTELPPPEKKVAAKALYRLGWGSRQVEKMLGISDDSVRRYAQEATPDELRHFEAEFNRAIGDMKREGIAIAQQRLHELIPKERRIDQVVRAAEYFEGKNQQQNLTQVNIGGDLGVKVRQYAREDAGI